MVGPLDKKAVIEAIRDAERGTSGEIRVHLHRVPTNDALSDARKLFKRLGMHRTQERNGVLLFIAPKSQTFAIVGDEGIHARVGDAFWNTTRDRMQKEFSQGRLQEGVLAGVRSAGERLKEYFPAKRDDRDELSNEVTEE